MFDQTGNIVANKLVSHMFDQTGKHTKNSDQAGLSTMPSSTLSITASTTCANTFKPGLSSTYPSTMSPLKDRESMASHSLEGDGK